MAKLKTPPGDFDELKARFDEMAARSVASFASPRLPTKVLVDQLDIPRTSINNWLQKKVFELDADKHRRDGEDRLYSPRDAVMFATASQTSAIGLPLATAKALGAYLVAYIEKGMRTVQGFSARSHVVIFRRPGGADWEIIHYSPDRPEAHFFSGGEWKQAPLANRLDSLPPMRVEFNVSDFVADIVNVLQGDMMLVAGNADDMRNKKKSAA
ncbi:MAG: hypothetical protein Q8M19_24540 [Reyranella sp.]|nr:hypothetical protein [Reyranella sp.]